MATTNTKTISLDVNTIDTTQDTDSAPDHITFQVTQTGEQSFTIRTLVDKSEDGFGTLSSDTAKMFAIDTTPNWRLSQLKFENNKLLLLIGQDGTAESIAVDQLVNMTGNSSKVAMDKQQLDKEIAENAGTLGALRDDSTKPTTLGATGLNADDMKSIGGIGTKGEGGIGIVDADSIILGSLDKSLIDAVIKRNMARIRYCYQRELTENPTLAGKITVKLVIAKDGNVSSATIRTGTDEDGQEHTSWNHPDIGQKVGEAICKEFLKFQFPEPKGGGIVIVSYPFVFSPE